MWHYLYFLVLVKVKDPTEYTGPESYVAQMIVVSIRGLYCILYAFIFSTLPFSQNIKVLTVILVTEIGLSIIEEALYWLNHGFPVDFLVYKANLSLQHTDIY